VQAVARDAETGELSGGAIRVAAEPQIVVDH
jgi:hypothetical protein